MIQIVIGLVLAGLISAVAWTSWSAFKDGIAAPYVQAQRDADQKVVDAAEARAKRAEAQAQAAAAASSAQSAAIAEAEARSSAAQEKLDATLDAYGKLVRSSEARLEALRKRAATPSPDGRTCEQVVDEVDRILRDSARVRSAR